MPTLYLVEQGAMVECDGERLTVRRHETELNSIPIVKIDEIVVIGVVGFTTPSLKRLLDRSIPTTFLTIHGRYQGRLVGSISAHPHLRRAQYRRADDSAWAFRQARSHVDGKLRNCKVLLQRFCRNRSNPPEAAQQAADGMDDLIERVQRVTQHSSLLGLEGSGTARYFGGVRALLGDGAGFERRERRPPNDPVNSLLSLGYTLLLGRVLGAVETVGFDPYQGYLHLCDPRRPALALDLMEEFRPLLVDAYVIRCLSEGSIGEADFERNEENQLRLSSEGLRRFVRGFDERLRMEALHPDGAEGRPGKVSYLRCIELQARRLARAVLGEGEYEAFIVR